MRLRIRKCTLKYFKIRQHWIYVFGEQAFTQLYHFYFLTIKKIKKKKKKKNRSDFDISEILESDTSIQVPEQRKVYRQRSACDKGEEGKRYMRETNLRLIQCHFKPSALGDALL